MSIRNGKWNEDKNETKCGVDEVVHVLGETLPPSSPRERSNSTSILTFSKNKIFYLQNGAYTVCNVYAK